MATKDKAATDAAAATPPPVPGTGTDGPAVEATDLGVRDALMYAAGLHGLRGASKLDDAKHGDERVGARFSLPVGGKLFFVTVEQTAGE